MRKALFKSASALQTSLCLLTIGGITFASASISPAQAASLSLDLNPFTGSPASTKVTLDDQLDGAGKIRFRADVSGIADLRGLFFNVSDDALLKGLQISGMNYLNANNQVVSVANQDISYSFNAGNVSSVGGQSNNMNGGSGSHVFDAGVEIGKEGIGKGDDFRSAWFTLSLSNSFLQSDAGAKYRSEGLKLSYFANQEFGARLMSVGQNREGSSKLAGTSPNITVPPVVVVPPTEQPQKPTEVPEPGSAAAFAFVAIGAYRLFKRNANVKQTVQ
jgi:hypothetical protein